MDWCQQKILFAIAIRQTRRAAAKEDWHRIPLIPEVGWAQWKLPFSCFLSGSWQFGFETNLFSLPALWAMWDLQHPRVQPDRTSWFPLRFTSWAAQRNPMFFWSVADQPEIAGQRIFLLSHRNGDSTVLCLLSFFEVQQRCCYDSRTLDFTPRHCVLTVGLCLDTYPMHCVQHVALHSGILCSAGMWIIPGS